MIITLSNEELATVIAALRWYQFCGLGEPSERTLQIHEIATDGGDLTSLDDKDIDELVTRINQKEDS